MLLIYICTCEFQGGQWDKEDSSQTKISGVQTVVGDANTHSRSFRGFDKERQCTAIKDLHTKTSKSFWQFSWSLEVKERSTLYFSATSTSSARWEKVFLSCFDYIGEKGVLFTENFLIILKSISFTQVFSKNRSTTHKNRWYGGWLCAEIN